MFSAPLLTGRGIAPRSVRWEQGSSAVSVNNGPVGGSRACPTAVACREQQSAAVHTGRAGSGGVGRGSGSAYTDAVIEVEDEATVGDDV